MGALKLCGYCPGAHHIGTQLHHIPHLLVNVSFIVGLQQVCTAYFGSCWSRNGEFVR